MNNPPTKQSMEPSEWARRLSNRLHGYEEEREIPLNGCTLHAVALALDAAREDERRNSVKPKRKRRSKAK